MGVFTPSTGMPGISAERVARHRTVTADGYLSFLPGGVVLDGTKTRDPFNTDDVTRLQAGLAIGIITSSGKWANSALGVTDGAYASGTTLDLTVAAATELVRRVGTSGTFKVIGPPTAAGTVRALTATFSAVNLTNGNVTITALPVADVWTLTAPAGQDAGMYQLEVTTGLGTSGESTQVTAALAANANTATVDAALEALTNVGTGGVAAVYSDPTLTLTFAAALGPVHVRVLADTTNDGGVFEGGWAAVHTTTGVDGRFVSGSIVAPTDGSETPVSFLPDGWETPLPADGTSDMPLSQVPIAGNVDVTKLLPAVGDASLKQWLRDSLNTRGKFVFVERYAA